MTTYPGVAARKYGAYTLQVRNTDTRHRFQVEMDDASYILENATSNSLVSEKTFSQTLSPWKLKACWFLGALG